MIKVEIYKKEIEALDKILVKTECPVAVGFVLGTLRVRIQQEIMREEERAMKEKYAPKKK